MKNPGWTYDETVLAVAMVLRNDWKQVDDSDQRVHDMSAFLKVHSPFPPEVRGVANFRSPAGVSRKTADIATRHPAYKGKKTHGSKMDQEVLNEFLNDAKKMLALATSVKKAMEALAAIPFVVAMKDLEDEGVDKGVAEGSVFQLLHRRRERDSKLRTRKLDELRKLGLPILCQACGLNPLERYPDLENAESLVEVHHVIPLAEGGSRKTFLKDLAVLCPNCHRAVHRMKEWTLPENLIIQGN